MKIHSYQIKSIVENYFEINLKKNSRKRYITDARKIYCKLCREYTKESFVSIGRQIGKDHATILYHSRTADDLVKNEVEFEQKYLTLKKKLDDNLNWITSTTIPVKPNYVIHPARFRNGKSLREILIKRGQATALSYEIR